MVELELQSEVIALLAREAEAVDTRQWDAWLALFEDDAIFWVPAWVSQDETTQDPCKETSLMYIEGKEALSDRAWRVGTGRSLASTPLMRTAHVVGLPTIELQEDGEVQVRASWACHGYNLRTQAQHTYFGLYEYQLKRGDGGLSIARKRATILNDRVPSLLDFYCV